nr:hypothetical protein Iba_chr12bCG12750 [Ipomoea batatas]
MLPYAFPGFRSEASVPAPVPLVRFVQVLCLVSVRVCLWTDGLVLGCIWCVTGLGVPGAVSLVEAIAFVCSLAYFGFGCSLGRAILLLYNVGVGEDCPWWAAGILMGYFRLVDAEIVAGYRVMLCAICGFFACGSGVLSCVYDRVYRRFVRDALGAVRVRIMGMRGLSLTVERDGTSSLHAFVGYVKVVSMPSMTPKMMDLAEDIDSGLGLLYYVWICIARCQASRCEHIFDKGIKMFYFG